MACPSVLFWVAVLSASLPTSQSNRFLKSFEIHVDSYSSRLAALDDYITCCEGNVQGINPPKCVKANEPTVRSACLNEIEACLLEDPALPVPVTTADLTAGDEVVLLRANCLLRTRQAAPSTQPNGLSFNNITLRFPINSAYLVPETMAQAGLSLLVSVWHRSATSSDSDALRDAFVIPVDNPRNSHQVSLEKSKSINLNFVSFRMERLLNAELLYSCVSPKAVPNSFCQLPSATTTPITTETPVVTVTTTLQPPTLTQPTPVFERRTTTSFSSSQAPASSTSSSGPDLMVIVIIVGSAFVILVMATVIAMKCRQRRQKLQRVQAQVSQSPFQTQETSDRRFSQQLPQDTEGYLQPVRGRRTSPQTDTTLVPNGMARPSGPAQDYQGYLRPVRGQATGFVSNAAFNPDQQIGSSA
eukprot:m.159299 g.159299  ORF g.159299 m.159299 type:complete len:415 (-) comp16488_c0_seq1:1706-2950(-)